MDPFFGSHGSRPWRDGTRDCLRSADLTGIVEVRRGPGLHVGKMSRGALVDQLTFHTRITLRDGRTRTGGMTDVREALEAGLSQRLISRQPGADLHELAEVLDTMAVEARTLG